MKAGFRKTKSMCKLYNTLMRVEIVCHADSTTSNKRIQTMITDCNSIFLGATYGFKARLITNKNFITFGDFATFLRGGVKVL